MRRTFTLLRPLIITGLFCLLAGSRSSAQTVSLHIQLRTAKNDTLNNLSAQLYALPDTSLVMSKTSQNSAASFNIKKFSKYIVRISGIGYVADEKTISITDKPLTVTFIMRRSVTGMSNVVVVAKKPLVKQEDDKTIVDAEPLSNASTNAYEVLEKTPGAIVDQDGNVYLNSNSPATIQINGKEVKLSPTDLASLLKSLPAGSVSKIEILRTPSAKYDAASTGGIVNIVLKKGVKLGTNGSVNIAHFQGVYATETAGFNLNRSNGKINTFLSYQFTKKNNFEELNSTRFFSSDNSMLTQKAYTTYPGVNNYINAGMDIDLDKKNNVGFEMMVSTNRNKSDALNQIMITNDTGNNIGNNESIIHNKGNTLYTGFELAYDRKLDTAGSKWENELHLNIHRNDNDQDYRNNYYYPNKPTLDGNGMTSSRKYNYNFKSDLTYKFKKDYKLEAGFKGSISNSRNGADYFKQSAGAPMQADSFQTNTFKYREGIISGYLQISKTKWGFTFKPGLRLEATDISGHQIIPFDTSFHLRRTDLFPYIYLRHRIMKLFGFELNGNLVYRRSITRPYYESLNPYPKYVDQYLFDVGNPELKPQFTTNYEFNIVADEFPVFSIGINDTKDIFSNVTYQDEVTKIAYRTYDNLGKSKELYLRGVGGLPPGKKYFFYVGAQHNYIQFNGLYQGLPLSYKRGSWTFFMFQNYKPTPNWNIVLHGFMRTKGLQNFYELDNFGGLMMSVNRSVLKKKANVILSVNDIFYTNKYNFKISQGTVNATGSRVNDTRKVGLTIRYNFGIKPKEEKKPDFEQPESN